MLNNEMNVLRNEITANTTSILQNSQEIIFKALEECVSTGDFDEYKKVVEAQFKITSDSFEMLFNNAITEINNLSGETTEQFQEIQKFIRFIDGNIILGENGNELTLKIQNNRISFLQNDLEVAYFSDNKLYVKDGEFINSLQLGKFAFIPRKNDNLSFKKVGGD
jgi:hypothetical protein